MSNKSILKLLRFSDYHVQTWKNGRGTTREIAKDSGSPYLWRIANADLKESGPFSSFEGYERHLILLSGGPIELTHDKKNAVTLKCWDIHRFDGGAKTEATIESAGEDFNVFTLKGRMRAEVSAIKIEGSQKHELSPHHQFIYCAEGEISFSTPNVDLQILNERDSLEIGPKSLIQIATASHKARLIVVELMRT